MNDKRIALITGTNKGIGFEIARQLGKHHGMTVIVGARNPGRGREATENRCRFPFQKSDSLTILSSIGEGRSSSWKSQMSLR